MADVADVFTIIALPLTMLGLFFTYLQSRKTQKAADAAKASAQQTSQKIESLQTIASLAQNIEKLKTCPKLLIDSHWAEVATHLIDARDQLIIIIEDESDSTTEVQLKELKNSLNIDIRNLYSKAKDESSELTLDVIFDRITELQEIFVAQQTKIKKLRT